MRTKCNLDELISTPFSSETTSSHPSGAADIRRAGVIRSDFEQEIRYPIPEDRFFDRDAIFFVKPGTPYGELQEIFRRAKAVNQIGKPVKLKFPEGNVVLNKEDLQYSGRDVQNGFALFLEGFDGLYLEGNQTTFVIDTKSYDAFSLRNDRKMQDRKWPGGMLVRDCKNFHMQGICFDYDFLPYFTATVIGSDEREETITLEIDEEFRNPLLNNAGDVCITSYIEMDGEKQCPDEAGNVGYVGEVIHHQLESRIENNVLTIRWGKFTKYRKPQIGKKATLTFVNHALAVCDFIQCKDVYVESCTIYGGPSMGFVGVNNENLYLNRLKVEKKPDSDRHMTTTADGIHIVKTTGDLQITNCLLEGTHDDAVNINHGIYMIVDEVRPGFLSLKAVGNVDAQVNRGDVFHIYDGEFQVACELIVDRCDIHDGHFDIWTESDLGAVRLKMRGLRVSNRTKVLFRNNIIRNKRSRGILLQVADAVIENCAFMNVMHDTLSIFSEQEVTLEAQLPSRVIVRNCKFVNNEHISVRTTFGIQKASIAVFADNIDGTITELPVLDGIDIENNLIYGSGGLSMFLSSMKNSRVRNNWIVNSACRQNSVYDNAGIAVWNCDGLEICDNVHLREAEDGEYTPVLWIEHKNEGAVTFRDNTGLTVRKIRLPEKFRVSNQVEEDKYV